MLKRQLVHNDGDSILRAIDLQSRHRYAFWDCPILDAAVQGGASILLTEDIRHGREIDGVRIENPFLAQ